MGIMSNKVSRRVALGSIAGGLAGTAAVLSVLRARYSDDAPGEGTYETDWEKYVRLLDVPIKETAAPASCTLEVRPTEEEKFRVVRISAWYPESTPEKLVSQPPVTFSAVDGSLTFVPPVIDDKLSVAVHVNDSFSANRRDPGRTDDVGKDRLRACIIAFLNGHLGFYDVNGGISEELPRKKVSSGCIDLAEAVVCDYPKGVALKKGTQWKARQTVGGQKEASFEVTGYATVGRKKTVVAESLRRLDARAVQQKLIRALQEEIKSRKRNGDPPLSAAKIAEVMDETKTMVATETARLVIYIGIESGLVLRQESRITYEHHHSDPTSRASTKQSLPLRSYSIVDS